MLSTSNDQRRQGLKLSWMNWAGFEYLVGHRFYPNHNRFKILIYFLHETKSVCLHCIRLSFTKISVTSKVWRENDVKITFKVWRGEWLWNNYSKTTKARNLKFGQITSLYMNLRPWILETLRHVVWGICTPNLWQRSSLTDFGHTKARNLKFGQMISLYMNLRSSNFGGATSHGLGHMHPKLVSAKFIKRFCHILARLGLAECFKAPVLER